MTFKDPDPSNQEGPASEGVGLGSCATVTTSPKTEEDWAEAIRLDLVTGTASYINAGRKFIQAKKALKKTNGSFTHLVTVLLGYDLDTAERWMEIARHPVLSDSATLRNLPTGWTTLYQLSRVPAKLLVKYIEDGVVHPQLTCRAAARLAKGDHSNRGRSDGETSGGDDGDDGRGGGPSDDHGGGHQRANKQEKRDADPGPDSPEEIARKLARLGELEREMRHQAMQVAAYEREVAELKAKLGPETSIRCQRKLFSQALRALQKYETPGTLEKERRFLRQSAATDLVELVRSAIRDGLKPERLELFYRPELH